MNSSSPPTDASPDRHISRLALIGAFLLPFGILLILLFLPEDQYTNLIFPRTWGPLLSYTLLPLAVVAPFATIVLGIISIYRIRRSNGAIYGMPLAVFVSLFYPLIVLDLILIFIGWKFLGRIEGPSIIPLAWFFLILVIDYLVIRFTWRAVNQ
jgi:hypothetical protein